MIEISWWAYALTIFLSSMVAFLILRKMNVISFQEPAC